MQPEPGDQAAPQNTPGIEQADPGATRTEVPVDDGLQWDVGAGVAGIVLLLILALARYARGRVEPPPPLQQKPTVTAPVPAPAPEVSIEPEPGPGLAARLRDRMARTREALQARFDVLFGRDKVDESVLEDLEAVLLSADVGVPTTTRILDGLRQRIRAGETDPSALRDALREEVRSLLASVHQPFREPAGEEPYVLLVVGVNGSGKTTTIGKLAARMQRDGHSVLLAAGDTFRAAAADQLAIWAERAKADIVRHQEGADPGAVVFDALDAAKARGADVVIVDTAGRLQTRKDLMEELSKVRRVIQKKVPDGPHETLLVVDGTQGQNALSQARRFHEAAPLTGVVVTKLDGTAKGGMVLAIAAEMGLPVKFVGIGEQVDDLRPFEVDAFVEALI